MKYEDIIRSVKNERMESAVATAAQLYLEHGIDEVKMTDIAEKCQIGVASLYRYFGTKQLFTVKVATWVWQDLMEKFAGVYDSDYYLNKSGIEQVEELLKIFLVLLSAHSDFLRFVSDFDAFVTREGITGEQLAEYESSILNTMTLMKNAVNKGIDDGTVKDGIDTELYYLTVAHSLMSMSQKFARGQILDSDNFAIGKEELKLAIRMYVDFIRA